MAKAADYDLGEYTFPRGWFMIAAADELDDGPKAIRFFGKDFALYRGESGKVVLLDAYCAHMGTHLTASPSASIVANGEQIEGDSIRCPYHGWRYGPDGTCEEIPYFDGPCPKAADIKAYEVREVMGTIMMWHDPEDGAPDYDPPYLDEWDDPQWVQWKIDHLGQIDIHPQEILDNMSDAHHLGPTHGAPCEYFENEISDHKIIQRQGGYHRMLDAYLTTLTWYTGPGLLLSKQKFGDTLGYEFIANAPIDDGVTKVWHGYLSKAPNNPPTEEDVANAREAQAGILVAFAQDFDVWKNKRPALTIMSVPTEGPFGKGRQWYKQFYNPRDTAKAIREKVNGIYHVKVLEKPGEMARQLEEVG